MQEMTKTINHYQKLGCFAGKNVIVTGPTGAIGKIVVKDLLACGATVVGLVHNQNKLEDFNKYGNFKCVTLDMESRSMFIEKFKEAMMLLQGRLDILIFCHGKNISGNMTEVSIPDFDSSININVRANFFLLSLATPFLKISKGNCVMISSSETKIVERGDFLHALSKSMVNSLVENAALELAPFGVRVNAVAPSFVNSSFRVDEYMDKNVIDKYLKQMKGYSLLENQIIEPAEVAEAILFLASPEAGFMTGEIMNVDSGFELNHDLSFQEEVEGE